MKDRSDRTEGPNRHSELLNGKRPEADAQLIRDIFQASDKPSATPRNTRSATANGSAAARKRHDAHVEPKPAQSPEVTK